MGTCGVSLRTAPPTFNGPFTSIALIAQNPVDAEYARSDFFGVRRVPPCLKIVACVMVIFMCSLCSTRVGFFLSATTTSLDFIIAVVSLLTFSPLVMRSLIRE